MIAKRERGAPLAAGVSGPVCAGWVVKDIKTKADSIAAPLFALFSGSSHLQLSSSCSHPEGGVEGTLLFSEPAAREQPLDFANEQGCQERIRPYLGYPLSVMR